MPKLTAGILGGGKWGTSLGQRLNGSCDVKIYDRDSQPDMAVLRDSDLIVVAVPSFAIREVISAFKPFYSGQPVVGISKGLEKETGLLSNQIIEEIFGGIRYAHLSGPSFADEVSRGLPTMLSLALTNFGHQKYFQNIIDLQDLRIQLTEDLIGVQLGGALKNVIAIAAGVSDALLCGENARAMLMIQGLQETVLLGKKLGAREETFFGPSGLGDLILTATSRQSRNYRLGVQLVENSQNNKSEMIKSDTFEGASTAAGAYFLARKFNLKLPLIEGVYKIIYENKTPGSLLKEI